MTQEPTLNQENKEQAEVAIDTSRQVLAAEYAARKHRLFFVDLGLGLILLVILFLGLSQAIKGVALMLTTNFWGVVAIYGILLGLLYTVINFPLTYYSGYVLSKHYKVSVQSFGDWLLDFLKQGALGAVLGLVALEVVYTVLDWFSTYWWVITAGLLLLFTVVMANLAPVLIMPIFYKFRPLENEELRQRLLAMTKRANTYVRGIYTMELSNKTTAANAAFMGIGNTKRIVIGDTLLKNFDNDEIEVVLAHELGHQVHNDIWKLIGLQTFLIVAGLWLSDLVLRWSVSSLGYKGLSDIAAFPVFILVMTIFGLMIQPLSNWYSRRVEHAADVYALTTTQMTTAFIGAMTKLANQNLAELEPARWVVIMFYDHPAIADRIAYGKEYAATH